jgi:hypothetical protein
MLAESSSFSSLSMLHDNLPINVAPFSPIYPFISLFHLYRFSFHHTFKCINVKETWKGKMTKNGLISGERNDTYLTYICRLSQSVESPERTTLRLSSVVEVD